LCWLPEEPEGHAIAAVNQSEAIAATLTQPRRRALGVLARRGSAWLANVTDEQQGSVNWQAAPAHGCSSRASHSPRRQGSP
jgi:hypothetical protein